MNSNVKYSYKIDSDKIKQQSIKYIEKYTNKNKYNENSIVKLTDGLIVIHSPFETLFESAISNYNILK